MLLDRVFANEIDDRDRARLILRQARAIRCSSFAGFHGKSTFTTALAACKLSPTLPLSVERNSRQAGSCLEPHDLGAPALLRY